MMKMIILFAFALSIKGFSFDQLSEKEALRGEITDRITNVIKVFDSEARVDVSIQLSKRNKKIKVNNPFLLSLDQENGASEYYILKLSATIFTRFSTSEIPTEVTERINAISSEYSRNKEVFYSELQGSTVSPSFMSQTSPFEFFVAFILLFACSFGVFVFYQSKKQASSNIGSIVEEGIKKISNSLDSLGTIAGGNVETTPFNIEVNSGKESFLLDVSLDSLEEVLMDCYWCEEDRYGAYLWERLDVLRKGQLIEKNKRMADYGAFLQSVEPENKKFVTDSYYLSPLSLESIDNESLTKLVEKYNSVFHLLPKIRIDHLDLSAIKKKELYLKKYSKEDTQFEIQNINWDEYKTTISRPLDNVHVFSFKDFDEEEEFFKENSHDVSLIHAFPSLSWLTVLREEDITEILSKFTAKQLAIAWHAPSSTLEKLEECLPEEKLHLLKTYQESLTSNRNNSVYQQIIAEAIVRLEKRLTLAA